jgi:hypothetical protein
VDLTEPLLATARDQGLKGRRLADRVAGDLQISRRRVYQAYLALKEQGRLE